MSTNHHIPFPESFNSPPELDFFEEWRDRSDGWRDHDEDNAMRGLFFALILPSAITLAALALIVGLYMWRVGLA